MTVGYGRAVGPALALALPVLLVSGCAARIDGGGPGSGDGESPSTGNDSSTLNEWRTDGCRTARSPQMVETAGARMPVTPADLDAVMGQIEHEGRARFAESYAGLEVVPEQVRTIVYRVPSAPFDVFVREVAGDTCVVVRDAAYSAVQLAALADRISADLDYWRERDVRINTVGPRHDGSAVQVGTEDVARARVELPKRYGVRPPVVVVEEAPVVPL